MGTYRIAKRFEIEAGHRLHKHPEKCRYPHGHSYAIEVVVRSDRLDANDMVCDYKALKVVVAAQLEHLDHAMIVAAEDPLRESFAPFAERMVVLQGSDPTTEAIARSLFERVRAAFLPGTRVASGEAVYTVPDGVIVERVRVWETSSTWAEYSAEA